MVLQHSFVQNQKLFGRILPENSYDGIVGYYIDSNPFYWNKKITFNSVIINKMHLAKVSNWNGWIIILKPWLVLLNLY